LRFRRSNGPAEPPATRSGSDGAAVRFFFYFEDEEASRASAAELERVGYSVEVTPPDDEVEQWELLAGGVPRTDDLDTADKIFGTWARSRGGDYDGHEVVVGDGEAGRRRGPFAVSITEEAVIAEADPTWVMQNSEYPFWVSLRQRLAQEGIDHKSARVVESFEKRTFDEPATEPRDFDLEEVCVLVTDERRVLEYRYSNRDQAWVAWVEITDSWREGPYAGSIAMALTSRQDESS
jgi:hypothetical protein